MQQTVNTTVYGELGRFPLIVYRKIRILKFWYIILKNNDKLIYRIYSMRNNNDVLLNKWSSDVRDLLNELGFPFLWNNQNITNDQLNILIARIKDQYLQQWQSEINSLPKLETYCIFKNEHVAEKYLLCVSNLNYRTTLCRFRCSAHKLLIEEGRHRNIPRSERICLRCNMNVVENEYHFLLVCPFYREIRYRCLPNYYCSWPSIQKFRNIMTSSQKSIINKLAKYLYLATCKRDTYNQ